MRIAFALLFATTLMAGQNRPATSSSHANQPNELVRNVYRQVVARNPFGIPQGNDWLAFKPFLSQGLLRRIDEAQACAADEEQQNPDPRRAQRSAGRFEIFSGDASRVLSFKMGSAEPQKDGTTRVYVTLTPSSNWGTHRVAAIVAAENGHFVLDDVIYLDDAQWDHEEDRRNRWLSHYLAAGCSGPRWIGAYLPKQPEELAQSLYANVVAHPTSDIPSGEDWKIFEPYLSHSLLHKIDIYGACVADELRYLAAQKGPPVKPSTLAENGIFSGGDEEEAPRTIRVEKAETLKTGAVRVTVMLGLPQYKMQWPVIPVFLREHGRFVLGDVIFPDVVITKGVKDNDRSGPDAYLSHALTEICHGGTRWNPRY